MKPKTMWDNLKLMLIFHIQWGDLNQRNEFLRLLATLCRGPDRALQLYCSKEPSKWPLMDASSGVHIVGATVLFCSKTLIAYLKTVAPPVRE